MLQPRRDVQERGRRGAQVSVWTWGCADQGVFETGPHLSHTHLHTKWNKDGILTLLHIYTNLTTSTEHRDEAKYEEFKRLTEELVKETGSLQWKKGH